MENLIKLTNRSLRQTQELLNLVGSYKALVALEWMLYNNSRFRYIVPQTLNDVQTIMSVKPKSILISEYLWNKLVGKYV